MSPLCLPAPLTRRGFLAGPAVSGAWLGLADRLFGSPTQGTTKPDPRLEKLGAVALSEAKKQGASYCDIRINRYRDQYSGYRLSPQRGSTVTDEVPFVQDSQSFGFGVRVIALLGGFSATPR